jgi:beta-mannosidase
VIGPRPLDGDGWRIRGFLGDEAAVRAALRPGVLREPGWMPAHVPGSIVDDLARAGAVADPYRGLNSRTAEWASARAWLYVRTFDAPAPDPDERVRLRFDGLDFGGTIVLDGTVLGEHCSMYAPAEWEVTAAIRDGGEHVLAVVLPSAPPSEPQLGRTSLVRVHKGRMTYGWDFCPRLVHQGIWRTVSLATTGRARIVDAWARARAEGDGGGVVRLTLALEPGDAGPLEVEASLSPHGSADILGRAEARSDGDVELDLTLEAPAVERWWPNGSVHGRPALYDLHVRLADAGGREHDARRVPVGFRTLELAPNPGAPAGARPYTFVVNGEPTYATGWNWAPLDACYGVPRPDRLGHLLRLARNAGVNLLRVWGGGLIESDAFYDACDRFGILVWQEFSQSSSGTDSVPSDDPAFVSALADDARAIVPLRRNHPSLALWCGGNELEDADGPLDDARSPALAALRDVVATLDPDRPWLPTSPTGPEFANRLEVIERDPDGLHDVHGPWEHQGLRGQQSLYDAGTSLLSSEFGVEGMANRRALEALVPADDRWPPTRANPVYRHLGDWWVNEPLVQAAFGGGLRDLEAIRRASQWLQAEGLRYAVEANRRRWPRNSGSIPWQLYESYPNAWSTSAIDHRGDPKPACYAVAAAYEPVHVCASYATVAWAGEAAVEARVWTWSSAREVAGASAEASLVELDGTPAASERWTVDLPATGVAVSPGMLTLPLVPGTSAPLLLDLSLVDADGSPLSVARVPLSRTSDLAPFLDVGRATLDVRCVGGDDQWSLLLRNAGPVAALGIVVGDDRPFEAPGWAEASAGWFHLLPGEARELTVRWADAPLDGRRLRVEGWNVEGRNVEGWNVEGDGVAVP